MHTGRPASQSSLPKKQVRVTEHQQFNTPSFARVQDNSNYESESKVTVVFLNRTQPAPVWVFDGPKPEVGDFVVVAHIDGQKNNPYVSGIVAFKGRTSNYVRVEDGLIRIQLPTEEADVTGGNPAREGTASHLRDDATYLTSRSYIELTAQGITIHAPSGTPVNIVADTVSIGSAGGTAKPVARVGDTVSIPGIGTGSITGGSSNLRAT